MDFLFQKYFLFRYISLLVSVFGYALSEVLHLPCGKNDGEFSIVQTNSSLRGALLQKIDEQSHESCIVRCTEHVKCQSINYHRKQKKCELNSEDRKKRNVFISKMTGWLFARTPDNQLKVGNLIKNYHTSGHKTFRNVKITLE